MSEKSSIIYSKILNYLLGWGDKIQKQTPDSLLYIQLIFFHVRKFRKQFCANSIKIHKFRKYNNNNNNNHNMGSVKNMIMKKMNIIIWVACKITK